MNVEAMIESVKDILEKVKNRPGLAHRLTGQSDLIGDVGLDSLEMIDFMLKVEQDMGIVIDFERLEFSHLSSIRTLCEFFHHQSACLQRIS